MRKSLRIRLLISYFLLVALFGGGVALTLAVVSKIAMRTERLIDHYWQDNNRIAELHSVLGEVIAFVARPPRATNRLEALSDLQRKLESLAEDITASTFPKDFRDFQVERLSALKESLSGPFSLLDSLDRQRSQTDTAIKSLLGDATALGQRELILELTIIALAYHDFLATANVSDRDIFQHQMTHVGQLNLPAKMKQPIEDFGRKAEVLFTRRLELRHSREQILSEIRSITDSLHERAALYLRQVIAPEREKISQDFQAISMILLSAVFLSGLLAMIGGVWLSRRIALPIEGATATITRIAQGDLDVRVKSTGQVEFDRLEEAVNSLAVSFQTTLGRLQKLVEEHAASEERYRQIAEERVELERIINHSPTVAFLCRAEAAFPVTYMSESVAQFGFSTEYFREQQAGMIELVHPLDRDRVVLEINERLENRSSREFFVTWRVLAPEGGVRWVDARLMVQRLPSGQAMYLQGVLLDITERMQLQEQAAQASRLASLGELAAGVAHEINNPNALIFMNATVLKEISQGMLHVLDELWQERGELTVGRLPYGRLRADIPRLHEELVEASSRIRRIVNDLKEFARTAPPDYQQDIDLNEVAQVAVRLTGNALKKATDRFSAAFADSLPTVKGNPQRLEQVIVNLLMNACQSLQNRHHAIRLTTSLMSGEEAICLTVSDEGGGIAPEILPHVTDPFFTTRREMGGTGLGLSISARIMKEHGGRLDITSQPGSGTIVQMILPIFGKETTI